MVSLGSGWRAGEDKGALPQPETDHAAVTAATTAKQRAPNFEPRMVILIRSAPRAR